MEVKTKKHFNEIIKSLTEEILDEEDLDEMTVTGNVAGYSTPFAFSGKKGKKKKKEVSTNSTGYEMVNEELEKRDIKLIRLIMRDVIADVLYRIWIKRNSWKNVG